MGDFRIGSSSPAKNIATTNILKITSAGSSGTSFDVTDGRLVRAGYGLVEGDQITVGSTTTRVMGISGNTVTVSNSVTWSQSDAVFFGTDTTPDIGAYSSEAVFLTAATISSVGTTYTVETTGDARGVWFYVDGIPTIWDYDAPFSSTITSGSVTAKAYALNAQADPVVDAVESGGGEAAGGTVEANRGPGTTGRPR
jgi:hypothetical protein